MSRWWSMVRKEWLGLRWIMLLAAGAIAALDIFLAYKVSSRAMNMIGYNMAIGLSTIPFAGLFIASLVAGYLSMRNEWQHNTSVRLLSYPVSGASLISAKLATTVFSLTVLAVWAGLGTLLVATRTPNLVVDILRADWVFSTYKAWEIWAGVAVFIIVTIALLTFINAVGMFSFVVGTLVPRVSGLLSVVVYCLVTWVSGAFAPLAMYLASFVPNLKVIAYGHDVLENVVRIALPALPLWPLVAGSVVLVLCAGRMLDREVDA